MKTDAIPQLGIDGKILEGIVATRNSDGSANVAPMGPIVDAEFDTLVFRPFKSSTTYQNLVRTRRGVLHVTDDVELFAAAAIGVGVDAEFSNGDRLILANTCRAYEFKITSVADTDERAILVARVLERHMQREFFGFNRAQIAVIEAAILATRLHLLPHDGILAEFGRLETIVNKTGAAAEHRAFDLLKQHVAGNAAKATLQQVQR